MIDAVLNGGEWRPIMEWLDATHGGRYPVPIGTTPPVTRREDGSLRIVTLEGVMTCEVGDWLIRGVEGEFYPCKPAIFDATYEPVIA